MFLIANASVFIGSDRPMRLSPQWVDTPDHARTRDLVRRWYLGTINDVAPEVVDDLARGPLTQYRKAISAGIALDEWLADDLILLIDDPTRTPQVIGARYWKDSLLDDPHGPLSRQEPEAQLFRDVVQAWAKYWNLPWETWCIGQAVYCLSEWLKNGEGSPGQRQWHCLCGGVADDPRELYIVPGDALRRRLAVRKIESDETEAAPPFKLIAPGSDNRLEHPEETETRLRMQFESELRNYLESRTRPLPVPPLVPPPDLREPGNHLDWLVRYNVLKESYPDIARKSGRARSTVSEGIKGIAAFASITLREPDPPGRPSH